MAMSTWQRDVASTAYATGTVLHMLLCAIACAPALPPAWHSYSPEHYHTYGELELSQPSTYRVRREMGQRSLIFSQRMSPHDKQECKMCGGAMCKQRCGICS